MSPLRGASLLIVLAGCAELPPIEANVCGNGILEPEEDCDGAVDPSLDPAARVRCGPGDDEVEARQCKFVCIDYALCPDGFACGDNGACRMPSARFAAVDQSPLDLPVRTVVAEDVDGDGEIDLIGSGSGRLIVRYGDGSGRFDSTLTSVAPLDPIPVTTADFDGNGTLDFVYGFGGAWLARTTQDRRLDPATARLPVPGEFPGGLRGVALNRNIEPGARRDMALITLVATGSFFAQAVFPRTADPTFLPGFVYHSLDELTEVPVANIDDVPGRLEDDYALAFRGEDRIWIYGLTPAIAPASTREQIELRATVSLSGLGVVDRGTYLDDIDGDGKVDLMISLRNGDQPAIAVAKGDGLGNFAAAELDDRLALACAGRPNCDPWPLAVADLNLDGRADFVLQDQVLISRTNGEYHRRSIEAGLGTRAIITDLNGDGLPDVAISSTTTGVVMLIGDGLGYFTVALAETRGVPVALVAGDFDGDLVGDLAVADTLGDGVTDVSVMFGADHELPGAPIHQASFEGFRQLGALQAVAYYDIGDELLVLTEEAPGVYSGALMIGTFIRIMVAPFRLQESSGSFFFEPSNLVVGRFDADARPDAIAFSRTSTSSPFDDRIFIMRGVEGELLDAPTYEEAIDYETSIGVAQFDPRCALLTAADFDGDGIDEVIGVSDKPDCTGAAPLRLLHASFTPDFEPNLHAIETGLTEPIELTAADIDADGHLDLIIVFRGTPATGSARQDAGIIIFYGDADGLTLDTARLVQTSDLGFDPISVATVQADVDPELELAILTGDGLRLADATEPRLYTVGDPSVASLSAARGHVVSGDFNNDGLDDLITVTELGARVLLAVPAPPGPR